MASMGSTWTVRLGAASAAGRRRHPVRRDGRRRVTGRLLRLVGSAQRDGEGHGEGDARHADECHRHPAYAAAARPGLPRCLPSRKSSSEVGARSGRGLVERLVDRRLDRPDAGRGRGTSGAARRGRRRPAAARPGPSPGRTGRRRPRPAGGCCSAGTRAAHRRRHLGAGGPGWTPRGAARATARPRWRCGPRRSPAPGRPAPGRRRHPLERLGAQLLETAALLDGPVVVPAGQQLVAAQGRQQLAGDDVGHRQAGEPRGPAQVVDVHLHSRSEGDRQARGLQQARAPLLALEHRAAEAGQRPLVGAVGPQRAGDPAPGRCVPPRPSSETSRCSRWPSSTSAPSTTSCQPPSRRRRVAATATALCSVMSPTSPRTTGATGIEGQDDQPACSVGAGSRHRKRPTSP